MLVEGFLVALLEVLIISLVVHLVVCSMAVEVVDDGDGAYNSDD